MLEEYEQDIDRHIEKLDFYARDYVKVQKEKVKKAGLRIILKVFYINRKSMKKEM
jgi:hypothetical protein